MCQLGCCHIVADFSWAVRLAAAKPSSWTKRPFAFGFAAYNIRFPVPISEVMLVVQVFAPTPLIGSMFNVSYDKWLTLSQLVLKAYADAD